MGGRGRRNYGGNKRRSGRGGHRNRGKGNQKGFGASLKPIDWRNQNLLPFQKDFYKGRISNEMKPTEIQQWRSKYQMSVIGENCPQPVRTFEECGLPRSFLKTFQRLGFKAPTPIQSQGWPMALTGRDMVGVAQTGSGKTLAFILPAIIHVQGQKSLPKGTGPIVLIVAPTRELACQIEGEAKKFAPSDVRLTCVYGGASQHPQANALRQGVEICVCTPGRMLDFLENEVTNFRRVSMLIFDEADRMLDMGFEPQIRKLCSQIRPDRQVLMWSATWPKAVQRLANDFLPNNKLILKIGGDSRQASKTVTQHVYVTDYSQKDNLLLKTLNKFQDKKMIIFVATKRKADKLTKQLTHHGLNASAIHGNKSQRQRNRVLAEFKSGEVCVLVATDVASRGIHVDDILLVINYDFPQSVDDYVHRIGRTGRAGKKGTSVTFFDPDQVDPGKGAPNLKKSRKKMLRKANGLVKLLHESNQTITQELAALAIRGGDIPKELVALAQGGSKGENQFVQEHGRGQGVKRVAETQLSNSSKRQKLG